jgi:hypothetical protein
MREAHISKRLDWFLIFEAFLDKATRIKQWVSLGGDSNHNPVMLEIALAQEKPANPFKLNPEWMKEEEFINKIKEVWVPYDGDLRESSPIQFHQNLKKSKKVAMQWEKDKKVKDEKHLGKWRKLW